jgi:hypothetical protein
VEFKPIDFMNPYKILEVSENASLEEIKKAYHKKAHENHPDKGGDDMEMKRVNKAYEEILKIKKSNSYIKSSHQDVPSRPVYKCNLCKKDTHYSTCIDCWIKIKREEKRQRIQRVRSCMFCLNCEKSLSNRSLNTIFCNKICSKEYYRKAEVVKLKKICARQDCLSEEQAYRLKSIKIEEILHYTYKERIIIFTRLIGKKKALWLDSVFQEKFSK